MVINTLKINEVQKEILKLKKDGENVIVKAQGDDFNRKIVENSNVDILLNVELHNRKDYMKQRDSGLNEILCKLAKKNEIRIGIDLKGVIKLKGIEKAKVLSRIRQNIRLCKRVGTSYIIMHSINYRKQDIASFLSVLGASTGQIKVGR